MHPRDRPWFHNHSLGLAWAGGELFADPPKCNSFALKMPKKQIEKCLTLATQMRGLFSAPIFGELQS